MFGSSSPFGASTPTLFGGASSSSSPFGASTSTSPFGMNTASTNPFAPKPFGSTTPSFGAQSSTFGAQSSTFGAQSSTFGAQTGGLFGSGTATGVFGSQAAPFGSSSPAFGSTTSSPFGTTQSAFGTSGSSVFGQQKPTFGSFGTTPAASNPFGTPTFGQTQSAFGAQPFGTTTTSSFGTSAFGTSTPAQPTPVFGTPNPFGASSTPSFGSTAFGQTAPAFGTSTFGSGFGTQPSSTFGAFGSKPGSRAVPFAARVEIDQGTQLKMHSISAMDQYKDKSPEELRWEDYQAGDKGGAPPGAAPTGVFGQPSTSNNPFGSVTPSSSFQTPSLTASPNPFGTPSTTTTLFNQQKPTQPSFGSFSAPSASTTPFGISTTQTPSLFGTTSSLSPAASFGAFSTPSFSTSSSFNINPSPSTSPFGVSSTTPSTTPGIFGTPTQSSLFPGTTSSLFSNPSANAFNINQPRPAQQTPLFAPAQTSSPFSFQTTPNQPVSFGATPNPLGTPSFGQNVLQSPMPNPVPAPVNNTPFGTLPAMPQMTIGRVSGSNPSVHYGISNVPVLERSSQLRSNSLLTPRHIAPRSKIRMQARKSGSLKKDAPRLSFFSEGEEAPITPKADVAFIPRENPRALFIHQVQSPITPVSAKRAPETTEQNEEVYNESSAYPVADEEGIPREPSGAEWSIPENTAPANATRTPEKLSKSPSKQNGIRDREDRGNGYMSMTGHRAGEAAIAYEHGADIEALMPKLRHADYYTEPRVQELAAKERAEPGYCRRVLDFIVGRKGYGHIKFLGETDVRRLDIEGIIQLNKCEVLVYMDESKKPPLGQGLNKPASVTLLNVKCVDKATGQCLTEGPQVERFEKKLKKKTQAQGAEFVSWDSVKGEWTFRVKHFSRYGLDGLDESDDSDEENPTVDKTVPVGMDMTEGLEDGAGYIENDFDGIKSPGSLEEEEEGMEEVKSRNKRGALPHSLPAQLGLNPVKMQQLKSSFFPLESDELQSDLFTYRKFARVYPPPATVVPYKTDHIRSGEPKRSPRPSKQMRLSPRSVWQRSPMHSSPQQTPLLAAPTFSIPVTKKRPTGFRLEEQGETKLICTSTSDGCVDAALFMGTSFRAGWGPNGVLVHTGTNQSKIVFSSCVKFERVALDRTVRDERGKPRDGLLGLQFNAPLMLHKSFSKVVSENNGVKLRSLVCNKLQLEKLCDDYEDLIEKQHAVSGISAPYQLVLKHQVMTWQLISVLFSEKEPVKAEAAESMAEMKARIANIDPETESLGRRAEFSSWLQDSVFHLVQADLEYAEESNHLLEIFILLTGKQVESGVKKAVSEGDVRLACLLSQASGSVTNREDIASQLEMWDSEGILEEMIEKDRVLLFKLLAGDIHGALGERTIDWKRFLGMLMWYMMPPESELPDIVHEFRRLVEDGDAPKPAPMYLEEAESGAYLKQGSNKEEICAYDSSYYLMLLHANGSLAEDDVHKMFSSSASTFDPLDHRAAWHQKSVLQAIGVLGPCNSYTLDMSFVSQLLAAGLVHWAVYVILHITDIPGSFADIPGIHEKVIKEILHQYCEVWSSSEIQRTFLEKELGIPTEWLHETLAMYCLYRGDYAEGLEHLLKGAKWHDAHVVFMTRVCASLFLNGGHAEIWNAASQMETHKMEIENWDLGAGMFVDFFTLRGSFQSNDYDNELESPAEAKMCACKDFFERLKDSQRFWEARASKLLRVAFAQMGDEIAGLLVAEGKMKGLPDIAENEIYNVVLEAPLPEDIQLCRLQGAVSSFTTWISQGVTA